LTYQSSEAKFYYVVEDSYGVIPDAPAMIGIQNVESVEPAVNPGNILLRGIGSRDVNQIKMGLRRVNLKVAYEVPSDDVLSFMQHALTLYPLTCEVIYDKESSIVDLRHLGCKFDQLTVQCSVEDVLKATVDLVGQDLDPQNATISDATYTDFGGGIGYNQCFVQRGNADGSNLQTLEEITDWKFTVNNNLKAIPVIRSENGGLLKFLQSLKRDLTGEVTFDFESGNRSRFYDAVSDSEFSLKFGMGAKYFLFKYCKWDIVASPTKLDDLVPNNVSFTSSDVTSGDV